jgi:asparagine synthetase B (glutamine-hydrolysing)
VNELPPGHAFDGTRQYHYEPITIQPALQAPSEEIAVELSSRLEIAVKKRISSSEAGVWLSGGLDSSLLSALARPHVRLEPILGGLCLPLPLKLICAAFSLFPNNPASV